MTDDPAPAVGPPEASPMEAYRQLCQAEARRQGAPEGIVQGTCRCLRQRLDGLGQPPAGALEDLKAFTEENRLACVFQAILEL